MVDFDKCNGCEKCVSICVTSHVFEMVDGKADPVNSAECVNCEACLDVCEPGAITIIEM